jgi:hypothetical protein
MILMRRGMPPPPRTEGRAAARARLVDLHLRHPHRPRIVRSCVAARIQPKSETLYTLWRAEHLELQFRGYLK